LRHVADFAIRKDKYLSLTTTNKILSEYARQWRKELGAAKIRLELHSKVHGLLHIPFVIQGTVENKLSNCDPKRMRLNMESGHALVSGNTIAVNYHHTIIDD
jgi:hypothetical protein